MSDPRFDDRDHPAFDRRTVLRGVAVTGALGASGALISGCNSGGQTAGNRSSGTGGESGGGSGGTELGPVSAVPVGSGMIFEQQRIVVTQPSKGNFQAFSAVCQHQGCIVASVDQDTINCDCHGSQYSIDDGSVVQGPATQGLPKRQIQVQGNNITLA